MTFHEEQIGRARLILGDCREVLPTLGSFDALLTDPPYGIGITNSNRLAVSRGMGGKSWDDETPATEFLAQIREKCKQSIIWGGNYFAFPPARCVLVWDKQNDGRDFADLEMAWTDIDAVARIFRKRPMNMDNGKVHPAQKPIELMRWCLRKMDDPQTVLDPYMGSGTSGVAAIHQGRAFVGIERDPDYFEIAVRRIREANGDDAGPLFGEAA
jgi:site-specific DNA-methyltransferase (adenine-specific)/modification methylase